ncbi:hypothetical protein Cantr_10459 [Candida viswanathii]|uniref:Fibronectin type-III domain-containing protein n=1 Tax=Candida viswanathii TaxID=5486 RepID=A0A367YFX9_9ASCO|nr:hypothetical protein Cantr_10459 [Candida viswanathii]
MIEVLLTVIPSLCWLLYRFYLILKTPVEKLIEDLNIEIPHTPILCIDSISETSIVIHWDIEVKYDENLYYVIVINEQEAATLTSTSCKLNNLSPQQLYRIEILAINSITNFKSQSKPVYVQTCDPDNLDEKVNIDTLETDAREIVDTVHVSDDHTLESITIDQIKNIKDASLLNEYVIKFQNELTKINLEYKQYQSNVTPELDSLQRELCLYKQELDEETDNKLKKDNDVKTLEKCKDKLTFKKSKLITQLNTLKNSLALFNTKFQERETKLKKLRERNALALASEDQERSKINQEIVSVRQQIDQYKSDMEKVEDSLKNLMVEKKELLTVMNQLRPLVEVFNQSGNSSTPPDAIGQPALQQQNSGGNNNNNNSASIFNKDGSLTKQAFDAIVKIFQLIPSWQDEIMHEINQYQEFEQQWKQAFRSEIKKFVSVHQALELARMNLDKNYQPVKMTEYQASIEFGGFSNALPKPKFNGKRNLSPGEDQNKQASNFYNHYGNVYTKEDSDSDGVNSPLGQQQVITQQLPLHLPENIPPQLLTNDYYVGSNNNGYVQEQPQPSQQQSQPYISLEQINAVRNLDLNGANTTHLNGTTNPTNPLISVDSGLSGANTQFQGFPYDDNIYSTSINSPLPINNTTNNNANMMANYGDYNSLLYRYSSPSLSQSNLNEGVWGTSNLSSNDLLNPATQQTGFLMTPTQSSNIWLDDKNQKSLLNPSTHVRNVSNNSQIWRNDTTPNNANGTNNSASLRGFDFGSAGPVPSTSDFEPFGISINNNGNYGFNQTSNLQPSSFANEDERKSAIEGRHENGEHQL